jgi:hypothetical protein
VSPHPQTPGAITIDRCQHAADWYGSARTFHEWAAPLMDRVDMIAG